MDKTKSMKLSTALVQEIKAEKAAKGLTNAQLRELAGLSKSTFDRIIAGTLDVNVVALDSIAGVFGYEAADFLKKAQDRRARNEL